MHRKLVLSGYRMLPAEGLEGRRDSVVWESPGVQTFRIPWPFAPVLKLSLHQQPTTLHRCLRSPLILHPQHCWTNRSHGASQHPSEHKCRRSQIHGISSAISNCSTSLHLESSGRPFLYIHPAPPDLFLHDYTLSILHLTTTIGQPQQPE